MQGRQQLAAHKSDRRTVRRLVQLLAAVVVVGAVVVVAVAATVLEPGERAWRAGIAAASPGTG